MFEHILVPLDGSQRAEQAIPMAARLAKTSGASLLLLQAVPPLTGLGLYSASSTLYLRKVQERSLVNATAYLAKQAHKLEADGIETRMAVFSGQPAQLILDVAQEQEIDLIVLGSHGYTGFQRWALGSTSHKVLRHSTVPVLLLRAQSPQAPLKIAHPFRVTVALDGSPYAEATLLPSAQLVAALSEPGEGEIHLLQLVDMPMVEKEFGYMLDSDFNFRHEALQEAGNYLQEVHARLLRELPASFGLHFSWSVEECKDVADALIQTAEYGKGIGMHKASQLIALATHGRSGLQRWLLGSVTERVLHGSTLPLLVVHPSKTVSLSDLEHEEAAQKEDDQKETGRYKEKEDVPTYSRPS
ncbi:MAG TPA: universal stress protein [Ktedonobacteraceae bacterium]